MKILIDSNIYLNFYRRRGDQKLDLLDSLISFIKEEKFEIILPKQIKDEFSRRKKDVIFEHACELEKELTITAPIPSLLKLSEKNKELKRICKELKGICKELKGIKKKVIDEYKAKAFDSQSDINKKIKELFSLATQDKDDEIIVQTAYYRKIRGNPPKANNKNKHDSFGDAIIWETLLKYYTDDDLAIICADGDFTDGCNKTELHDFLQDEWSKKGGKDIKLYTNLGKFINDQSPAEEKPVKEETIQEEDYLNTPIVMPTIIDSNNGLNFSINSLEPFLFGEKNCECCGDKIDYPPISTLTYGGNFCSKCQPSISEGTIVAKKCSYCKKKYYESDFSNNGVFNFLCPHCRESGGVYSLNNIEI